MNDVLATIYGLEKTSSFGSKALDVARKAALPVAGVASLGAATYGYRKFDARRSKSKRAARRAADLRDFKSLSPKDQNALTSEAFRRSEYDRHTGGNRHSYDYHHSVLLGDKKLYSSMGPRKEKTASEQDFDLNTLTADEIIELGAELYMEKEAGIRSAALGAKKRYVKSIAGRIRNRRAQAFIAGEASGGFRAGKSAMKALPKNPTMRMRGGAIRDAVIPKKLVWG